MSDYNNNVRPSFRATGKSMQQAFLNAAAMMNGTDVNMDEISDILKEYQQTLQEGNVSLQDSLVIAQELLDKVSKIADNIIDEINETINKTNKKDVRVVVDLNPTNML